MWQLSPLGLLSGICLGDEFSYFVSKTDKDIRKKAVSLQRILNY